MLAIEININGKVIARASARNISDLADISDYDIRCISEPSPITGKPRQMHIFNIEGHDRNQSAWALVAKMAAEIAELERKDGTS